jgi:hypothetical protein
MRTALILGALGIVLEAAHVHAAKQAPFRGGDEVQVTKKRRKFHCSKPREECPS